MVDDVKYFNGLTTVNVELTNRCNKDCWMCGRRKVDRDYPEIALNYGDMDFELAKSIAGQLPNDIVVQLHNNGDPLLYPRFAEASSLFHRQIRCLDTNGKLLVKRANEIIENFDTLTISTFEKDVDSEEQFHLIEEFLKIKGSKKPNVIIRCLGDVDVSRYEKFGCIIARRILHSPMGSYSYTKNPTIPEIGICLEALNHMVIRRDGKVSVCVRFDPEGTGIIGNCIKTPLVDIWNGAMRKGWVKCHKEGCRSKIQLCSKCEYWGVPTGW